MRGPRRRDGAAHAAPSCDTLVKAALVYAAAHTGEIEAAIADDEWVAEHLLPLTPGFTIVSVDAAAP